MKEKIIIGNWKMNKTNDEAIALIEEIKALEYDKKGIQAVVCPPLTSVFSVGESIKGTDIELGAQNLCFQDQGAFTGEVSSDMLKALGVKYVIVGHSERREYYRESDEIVSKKFHKALEEGLIPILCVGETLREREINEQKEKVEKQLSAVFELEIDKKSEFIIAYEPIWAIGTGRTASKEDAQSMCEFIRNKTLEILGEDISKNVKIIYGGSVKPSNVKELMECKNIEGALVGGASLNAKDFIALLNYKESL